MGARTVAEVVTDGLRYTQAVVAACSGVVAAYWLYAGLDIGVARALSAAVLGVALLLSLVPCCMKPNAGREHRPRLRPTRRQTQQRQQQKRCCGGCCRARLGARDTTRAYAAATFVALICAWGCLHSVGSVSLSQQVHAQLPSLCDPECQQDVVDDMDTENCDGHGAVSPGSNLTESGAAAPTTVGVSACQRQLVVASILDSIESDLHMIGWFMVMVAETQFLQWACFSHKGCVRRRQDRARLQSPYREPSI
jgi:hypothetical protein